MTPPDQTPFPAEWPDPHAQLTLTSEGVHIWRANLDAAAQNLGPLEANLSEDEKSRAARFVFPKDRQRFIAARGILRQLLGDYLNRPAAGIEFTYGPQGKPRIRSENDDFPLQFNLSHSQAIAVFAFALRRELGIDVEAVRADFGGLEIAERYFSRQELEELRSLPVESQAESFFLCWTRKEAYVKARGGGLQIPLASFSVTLTPGRPETLQSSDTFNWTLRSFQASHGFVGAVIGEGKGWRPSFWNWIPARG